MSVQVPREDGLCWAVVPVGPGAECGCSALRGRLTCHRHRAFESAARKLRDHAAGYAVFEVHEAREAAE